MRLEDQINHEIEKQEGQKPKDKTIPRLLEGRDYIVRDGDVVEFHFSV